MTTITVPTTPRSKRDLVTNVAYEDLMGEVVEMIRCEMERLAIDSQEGDLGKIQFQSGLVEGGKRALARMKNYRSAALEDFRNDSQREHTPDMFGDE